MRAGAPSEVWTLKTPSRSGRDNENGEGKLQHSLVLRGFSLFLAFSSFFSSATQSCVCVWICLWVTAAVYTKPINSWSPMIDNTAYASANCRMTVELFVDSA